MLTTAQLVAARRHRPPPSLKQQYQEYLLQRIEGYKNSMTREQLLELGDEAANELQATLEGQFLLTEVLMLETVDRLIIKRLGLRPYGRWRQQFVKLRAAQREPTHWGLERKHIVAMLLPRLEMDDRILVVGAGAEPTAYLLAAHDADVTFIAGDLGCVERVESRMASESLARQFQAFVTNLGDWLPPFEERFHLVVIDAGALTALPYSRRRALLDQLKLITTPAGVHALIPGDPATPPEGFLSHYSGWERANPPSSRRSTKASPPAGLLLTAPFPACP